MNTSVKRLFIAQMTLNFLNSFMPQAIIIGFANSIYPDETAESSDLDLCCLTLSLSTLHINVFPNDSLLK